MLIEFRALAEADHGRIRKLPLPGGDVRGLEAAPEFHEQIIDVILDVLSASAAVRPEVRAGLLKHLRKILVIRRGLCWTIFRPRANRRPPAGVRHCRCWP